MWLFVFLNPYLTVEAPTLFLHVWPLSALPPTSPVIRLGGSGRYSNVAMEILTQVLCVCVFRKALQARKQDNRESSVINYSN